MNTIRYEYEDSNSNSSFAGFNGGDQPLFCQPNDSSSLTNNLEHIEDYYPYDFHHYHTQQHLSSGDGHQNISCGGDGQQSGVGHYQHHHPNAQQASLSSTLHCSETRVSSSQQCEDAFWNQHIADVLSDFSPSDIKLELLTDDILPMPSTSASETILTSNFCASNALGSFPSQGINKTASFESISSTILNKEDVTSFHGYMLLESHNHVIPTNKVENVLLDEENKENVRPSSDDRSSSFTGMPLSSHQRRNLQNRMFGAELSVDAFCAEHENQSTAEEYYCNFFEDNCIKNENDVSLVVGDEDLLTHRPTTHRQQTPSNDNTDKVKRQYRNSEHSLEDLNGEFDADELCEFDDLISASTDGHNRSKLKKAKNGEKSSSSSYSRQIEEPHVAGGFVKPSYSYSCLITLALKNSTTGDLTVSEIYAFLCEHFPYFRAAPSGWKNSVRHNLSLNKSFLKIEVETPGCHGRKSCLWRMNPHKIAKMDQELRKWRERAEPIILSAMKNPSDLNSIQNGTMGMPPNVRRRKILMEVVIPSTSSSSSSVSTPIQRPLPIITDSNASGMATPQNADSLANCELPYSYHHKETDASSNLYVMKQGAVQRIGRRTPYDVAPGAACSSLSSSSSSSSSSLNRSNSSSTAIFGRLNSGGESFHRAAARKLDYLLQQKAATIYNPVKELMLNQGPLTAPPSTPPSSRHNGSGGASLSSRRLTPQSSNSLFSSDGVNVRFTKTDLSSSHAIFEVCENKQQQHTGGGGINSVQYHYRQRDTEAKIKLESNQGDDDDDYDKNCRHLKPDKNNKILTSRGLKTVASDAFSKLTDEGGMFIGGASPLRPVESKVNNQIRKAVGKGCERQKQLSHAEVKDLRQLAVCELQKSQNVGGEDSKENVGNSVLKPSRNKFRSDCNDANKNGEPQPRNTTTTPLLDYMDSSYDIVTSALSNNPLLRFSQSPSKPLL